MRVAVVVAAALLAASTARGGDDARPAHDVEHGDVHDEGVGWWSFAGIPRFTYSVDDGFGIGLRGAAFWHRFDTSPYKTAITAQAWVTSNLVQHHYVRVDAVDAFAAPLRITAEAGFLSSPHQFFGDADVRIDEPTLECLMRYRVADLRDILGAGAGDAKLELVGGARAGWFLPSSTEPGLLVAPVAGVVLDTRDFESMPTKGVFADVTFRRADPVLGSTWAYSAIDAELAVFAPLWRGSDDVAAERAHGDGVGIDGGFGPVVLASRIVGDAIVGDAPLVELGKISGLHDTFAFGGQDLGRGLRTSRLTGPLKLMSQHELRATLLHLDVFGNDLAVGGAAYLDAGAVGTRVDGLAVAYGAGVGSRLQWNRNFVTRFDVAMSPAEGARIGAYAALGNTF